MALQFTVYEIATGRLLRVMEVPDMDGAMLNIDPGAEGTISGVYDPATQYRKPDGSIIAYPPRPSEHHIFDYGLEVWWDPRTPEQIEAQEAAALQAEREGMSIGFAQMMIGLVHLDWITEAEGEAWLDGILPQVVLDLIAGMPPEERFAAKARAKRPERVQRLDPIVNALALLQGRTPEEIDQFFRVFSKV